MATVDALWVCFIQTLIVPVHFRHRVVRGIYTYRRGASALLVQTGLGNAKASMRGTGNRYGLPALFRYMYHSLIFNILIRGVSRKDVLV